MATSPSPPTEPQAEGAAPAAKSSLLAKVNVLLFLLMVIVAECLVAYFYLPGSADNAALAQATESTEGGSGEKAEAETKESAHGEKSEAKHGEKGGEKHGEKGEGKHGEKGETKRRADDSGQIEVDLGEFSVTAYQPVSNSTLRIDFHLYGTIGIEAEHDFAQQMEESKHRFREQVLVIVRSADITDLTDAGLGLIKRKIQDKTNRILGKPLLRSVIVSDFSFVEQ